MGFERAFKRVDIDSPIHVARDSLEALEMLRGSNGREPIPRPHLIFLDLNIGGLSVCAQIVEAHEGTIELDDGLSEGTLIEVTLPCNNGLDDSISQPSAGTSS